MPYSFEQVIEKLVEMGYQRSPVAADKGEFAVRGGIIDIFPVSLPEPYQLEFWGDEVESLRIYDPIGQKSIRPVDEIELMPAKELEFIQDGAELGDIIDYLGANTLIILDDLAALEDRYASLIGSGFTGKAFSSIEEFMDKIQALQKLYWTDHPIENLSEVKVLGKKSQNYYSDSAPILPIEFQMFNRTLQAGRWHHPFETISECLCPEIEEPTGDEILQGVERLAKTDAYLYFLCSTEVEEEHLLKQIIDRKLSLPPHVQYLLGYLSNGMVIKDIETVLLPMTEITRRYKIRRQKQRSTFHTTPSEVYDLSAGELIVHLNNGIGRF